MARTTPSRPFDIADVFPELRGHRRTTTRLHPRTGAPTIADSSIGGPLLWPADEPWPMCTDGDAHDVEVLLTPATVYRGREIYAAAKGRSYTDEELAGMQAMSFSEPLELIHRPVPLLPVAQLYRRDVPDFTGPDDTDLLQVLWCTLGHGDDMSPALRLFWRRTADIGRPLATAPEPPVVEENHLPNPCVVHPEQVVDYQYRELLPKELQDRIAAWEKDTDGPGYEAWSVVPGWKVGGFASWRMTGPFRRNCRTCDTEMTLLFTVGSGEWDEAGTGASTGTSCAAPSRSTTRSRPKCSDHQPNIPFRTCELRHAAVLLWLNEGVPGDAGCRVGRAWRARAVDGLREVHRRSRRSGLPEDRGRRPPRPRCCRHRGWRPMICCAWRGQ